MDWLRQIFTLVRLFVETRPQVTLASDIEEARNYLRQARAIQLAEFKVVGSYLRFDHAALSALREAKDRLLCIPRDGTWRERNNFLIWGPAGAGKTAFVEELCQEAMNQYPVNAHGIDLKSITSRTHLEKAVTQWKELLDNDKALIVWIDECDQKIEGDYVLYIFLGPLEWNVEEGKKIIWIFLGSGKTKEELIDRLKEEVYKGPDVLRRLSEEHFVIPPLTAGDKVIIGATRAYNSGFIRAERIALMAIPFDPNLRTSGEIARRIENIRKNVTGNKLMFTHLFPFASTSTDFYQRHRFILESLESLGSIDINPD